MNGKQSKGGMVLAGSIHVAGPDILERLAKDGEVVFVTNHFEFVLKTTKAAEQSVVSFDPLIWINEADVTVGIDPEQGADSMDDETIEIRGADGNGIDLNVSVVQAEALARVLTSYVNAFRSREELEKVVRVNA